VSYVVLKFLNKNVIFSWVLNVVGSSGEVEDILASLNTMDLTHLAINLRRVYLI
jgi:hypothetical protein